MLLDVLNFVRQGAPRGGLQTAKNLLEVIEVGVTGFKILSVQPTTDGSTQMGVVAVPTVRVPPRKLFPQRYVEFENTLLQPAFHYAVPEGTPAERFIILCQSLCDACQTCGTINLPTILWRSLTPLNLPNPVFNMPENSVKILRRFAALIFSKLPAKLPNRRINCTDFFVKRSLDMLVEVVNKLLICLIFNTVNNCI
ncbi:Anaerobic dimethyl sulfoxide reductase chain A, putative [Babesia ovata]|uniref:Anaerobic dimethyl sulfoxide reductase chain A, putative n=1 Tax=Babesia ovata TaxID=189622 RepID=A0A2H6KBC6_9APIC|nr:Anaerobic dimethyl sulfoxide reductase chain A, putative [Babesia ovata]GBE60303.1 Anaerobic dimethyl sulfoxide reductase chain A, putative [Babesia ovata]